MTDVVTRDAPGVLIEPATLKIERVLPGPIERCWAYLTESELRRQWLASGEMQAKADTPFEFVWRNDELTVPPGPRPETMSEEARMQSRILAFDPPRKLVITWGAHGEVSFELEPKGDEVLLTLIHSRVPDRATLLGVSAGWHAHLEVLGAKMRGENPEPFWDRVAVLRADYDKRIPA